jgi:hypothetical protein
MGAGCSTGAASAVVAVAAEEEEHPAAVHASKTTEYVVKGVMSSVTLKFPAVSISTVKAALSSLASEK